MPDAAARSKRVAALSGYMLALLVVSGSVGLYRLDAESFRDDAQALLLLQRLDRHLAAVDPHDERMPSRWAAGRLLMNEHPEIHEAMIKSREVLTSHLMLGLGGHEPFGCDAFAQTPVEGKPLQEIQIAQYGWTGNTAEARSFALLSVSSSWLDRPRHGFADRGTVGDLIERLSDAQAPVRLRVVQSLALEPVSVEPCPTSASSVGPQQQRQTGPGVLSFDGAELVENAVVVRYKGMPAMGMQAQQQVFELAETVNIDADVAEVPGASAVALMRELADRERTALAADLDLLWSRQDALARLRTDYGFLPIDYAVSTAGAALVQGYAGANVFGLRVTARRLALVIAVAALSLGAVLLSEARGAALAQRPLRDQAPDGWRAALASSRLGRALVWSIAPAAAIVLAAPPSFEWLVAALVAAGLGAAACLKAAQADRSG